MPLPGNASAGQRRFPPSAGCDTDLQISVSFYGVTPSWNHDLTTLLSDLLSGGLAVIAFASNDGSPGTRAAGDRVQRLFGHWLWFATCRSKNLRRAWAMQPILVMSCAKPTSWPAESSHASLPLQMSRKVRHEPKPRTKASGWRDAEGFTWARASQDFFVGREVNRASHQMSVTRSNKGDVAGGSAST